MGKKKNDNPNDKEKEEEKEKGNLYDRIVKEDSDFTFDMFMELKYGMEIENFQPLQEKISRTLERELDSLYKIVTEEEGEKLVHIEYQTKNDKEMVERVQEYNSLIYRKYGIPIKHLVVYYGKEKTKMITQLPEEAIFRGFDLICLNEIEVEKFLNSSKPEVVILAPLGKYDKDQAEEILNLTFNKLEELPKYINNPSRYITKLQFYSKLRNLDTKLTTKIKSMPFFTNEMIKDHALYKEGKQEGLEQREKEFREKERALREEAEKKERALKEEAEKKERELKQKAEREKQKAQKKEIQAILNLHTKGVDIKVIAESYNVSQKRVKEVILNWEKQKSKDSE